jgi:hypothetical protein
MGFIQVDLDNATEEELYSAIEANIKVNSGLKEEIKKLSKATESSDIEIKEIPVVVSSCENEETVDEEDDFKDEADYYVSEYKALKGNIEDGIDDILPTRSNYNYKKIIMRLMLIPANVIKEINEIIADEESTLSVSELKELKDEIISLNKEISILRSKLKEDTDTSVSVKKENKLIFVPTSSGNIRVFDELKSIPEEYYEGFLGLFNSIKDGSFKNIRKFENNNKLNGLVEVKDFKIRVAFQRISKDTYVIVSMFMKKSQRDKGYRKGLEFKYSEYKQIADKLKKNSLDEEFMKQQKEYELELFRILSGEKDNGKGAYTND